jgi:hypothetical protein
MLGEEARLGTIVCRIASRVKFPPQAKGIDRQTVGLEAAMAGLIDNPARADAIDHLCAAKEWVITLSA